MNDAEMFKDLFERAAEMEPCGNARVVACVTNGRTYSYGYGQMKSHPFQKRFAKTEDHIFLHAEIDAIKNYIRWGSMSDLPDCEMYIMRVKREGALVTGLALPCEGCMGAIATFGMGEVFYTEDNATGWTIL